MQGKPPDWQDFIGIVVLLIINSTISFIEENNAGNAAAALMAGLAPKTKVMDSNASHGDCKSDGEKSWLVAESTMVQISEISKG